MTPVTQVLYTNSEHETIELTQTEDKEQKKTSEPTSEHLITVIDRIVLFV